METKVDVTKALLAFQNILDRGEKNDTVYHYGGLNAESDLDGYTLHLSDGQVSLYIYFHNRFELISPNSRESENFLKKIYAVAGRS